MEPADFNQRWLCRDCRGGKPPHPGYLVLMTPCSLCQRPVCSDTGGAYVRFDSIEQHGDFVARHVAAAMAPGKTAVCYECQAEGDAPEMGYPPLCEQCRKDEFAGDEVAAAKLATSMAAAMLHACEARADPAVVGSAAMQVAARCALLCNLSLAEFLGLGGEQFAAAKRQTATPDKEQQH